MYLISSTLSLILVILILHKLNFHQGIYSPKGITSITGVRCFLAAFVALSHAIQFLYTTHHTWIFNKDYKSLFGIGNFYLNLGKVGVICFFMISAFLFYRVVYDSNLSSKRLLLGRIRRIAPMYWFSLSAIIITGLIFTNFTPSISSIIDILRWMFFIGSYNIGDLSTSNINSGIEWTLKTEWMLYLSLPLIYFFTKNKSARTKDISILISILVIFGISFIIRVYGKIYTDPRPVLGFATGLITYRLFTTYPALVEYLKQSSVAAGISISAVILGLFLSSYAHFYLSILVLCSIAFIVIASGNSLFGILHNKTIVGIGEISYSLYLIHGIVLYYFTKFLEHLYTESILQAVFIQTAFLLTAIYISKYTYIYIEKRFYKPRLQQ